MEEKKRVRPTVAQVKKLSEELASAHERVASLQDAVLFLEHKLEELEKKYEEQVSGTSVLVKDCDAWRDKYRALMCDYKRQTDVLCRLRGRSLWQRITNK